MRLSVIVPVYNAEKYIDRCIKSLIYQSEKDMEIIAIDNHSSDNSLELLSQYKDSIRIVAQPQTYTQAHSMNLGVSLANGEYIAECDSDDYVDLKMYKTLLDSAEDCDVVHCGFTEYSRSGFGASKLIKGLGTPFSPMRDLLPKDRFLFLQFQPHLQSAIYRKSFITDNDLHFRENGIYEDTSLTFKIRTTAKRYKIVPRYMYFYCTDNPNSGTATDNRVFGLFEQYEEMSRWNKERKLGLDKELATMKFYTYLWSQTRRMDAKTDREFWDRAREEFIRDDIDGEFFYAPAHYRLYQTRRGY